MASLTIVVEGVEQKVPLESASVTLGRGLESDVRLKDIKASRRHCQVVKTPKGYQCVDLSSGNGTYVNGVQIKSQMLNPGDKITVGSTTIVFEDTPKAASSPKAATAKIPVAAAAPPPVKPAPGKGATARVQVAPTKRTTERLEAARSGSQVGLKPASQSLPKSSSHAIPKSGSRLGKAVPRPPSVRPPRPAVEAPAGKRGPAILIGIVALVALLGGGAYYFIAARDNGDQVKEQIEQLMKKGDAACDQERFEAALQEYRAALALCQGDRHKLRASELSKRIAQIDGRKGTGAPAKADPKEAPDRDAEFQSRKAEITERRKLGDASAADWAGALKDWNEVASRKSAADASRAQAEIRILQGKAREQALRLKDKADTLVRENKAAEALDLLKHQVDRFEGIDARADLDAAIKQLDK